MLVLECRKQILERKFSEPTDSNGADSLHQSMLGATCTVALLCNWGGENINSQGINGFSAYEYVTVTMTLNVDVAVGTNIDASQVTPVVEVVDGADVETWAEN